MVAYMDQGWLRYCNDEPFKALDSFKKALAIAEQVFTLNSLEAARLQNNIGSILLKNSNDSIKHQEALELLQTSMQVKMSLMGDNDINLLTGYINCANACELIGTKEMFQKALIFYK